MTIQNGEAVANELWWVPRGEVWRVLEGVSDPISRCEIFAATVRINCLYMVMRAGSGHLGSSFSATDLVSWLLLEEMEEAEGPSDGDIYFSSKGHDVPSLYAALIGLGRLEEDKLHELRRLGGLPGHPDVKTPGMAANTGSLGMGVSKAKGRILGNRLQGKHQRIFVMLGDGELQEGQIWESLQGAANAKLGELTVIVDNNKLQSDTWVKDVSDLGDLEAKFRSFGWAVLRCDGHDLDDIRGALDQRRAVVDRPVAIVADTVKGGGCEALAATSMAPGEWRYLFHSGAPSREIYDAAVEQLVRKANDLTTRCGLPRLTLAGTELIRVLDDGAGGPPEPNLVEAYSEALVDAAQDTCDFVVLDADLMVDMGLAKFKERYPHRFFECGIAEQDMVSQASGFSASGLLPIVHSFSCFLHSRPNEQIYNNATEKRKGVYVGGLAGIVPAGPGHSHQAVRDISAVGAVPDLLMVEPASPAQTRAALRFALASASSTYLRLVTARLPAVDSGYDGGPLRAGRGWVAREGDTIVAMAAGPLLLGQLLQAWEILQADGVGLRVVNLPWLNHVEPEWLAEVCRDVEHIFVVDNHYVTGGQASVVTSALATTELWKTTKVTAIGLQKVPECGATSEVLRAHGLDASGLAARIRRERFARAFGGNVSHAAQEMGSRSS
jgi:transketolase